MCVGVAVEVLANDYPTLFHMAAAGSWPLIQRFGLLSTCALLDRFEIPAAQRAEIEECHRPHSVVLDHPEHGRAIVRDQKPMNDRGLERALTGGLTPREWYRILNEKVFFWVQRRRLEVMMAAKAYREEPKTVLYVRTADLLQRHSARVVLAAMNTGNTKPFPHPRGPATFRSLADYPYYEYRSKKGAEAVVELAVQGAVPDVAEFVYRVEVVNPDETVEILFQR
jgi:hypothetical protein